MAMYGSDGKVVEIDEAKRIKGQEYKRLSTASDINTFGIIGGDNYATTSIGNGGMLDSIAQNHIEELDVEKEKSLIESKELLNEYSLYINGNITKAIQEYGDPSKSQLEKRMVEDLSILQNNFGLSQIDSAQLIINEYYGGNFLTKILGNPLYASAEDIERCNTAIRTILRLRMNYVNKITSLMSKMLRVNYKQLGLSEEQAEIYINSLKSNSNDSVQTAGKIKQLIKDNADKYLKNGGASIDLTPLGFGVILGPSGKYQLRAAGTDKSNKDAMLKFIQQAMRYDVVVIAHGEDGYTSEKLKKSGKDIKHTLDQSITEVWQNSKNYIAQASSEIINKYEDDQESISDIIQFYTNFIKSINLKKYLKYDINKIVDEFEKNDDIDHIRDYITSFINQKCEEISKTFESANNTFKRNKEKYTESIQNIIEKDKNKMKELYALIARDVLLGDDVTGGYVGVLIKHVKVQTTNGIWGCQPTKTLKAGPFTDVNELVRELIKEGYKKILIQDCNPGNHQLSEDIMKTKGVLINHSNFSNYFESSLIDSNDSTYISINEAEMSLKSFAESYDIDYNDDNYLEECYNWYKYNYTAIQEGRITGAIKDFFKRIVGAIIGFIKNIIELIKNAFHKLKAKFFGTKEEPKDTESKFQKNIETSLINIKNRKVEKTSSSNRKDLQKVANEMCTQISDEIKKVNQKQQSSLKNIEKDIDKLQDIEERQSQKHESTNFYNDYIDILLESYDSDLLDIINEFEVDGKPVDDENTDSENFDMDDNNDDTQQANNDNQDDAQPQSVDNVDDGDAPPNDAPDDQEFSMDDNTDNQIDTSTDQQDNNDTNTDQNDTNSDNQQDQTDNQNNNNQNDENFDLPDDNANGDDAPPDSDGSDENFDMDSSDDSGNGDSSDDSSDSSMDSSSGSDQGTIDPKLKDLESVIFDDLSENEKKMKIKELKDTFIFVYKKCDSILEMVTDVKKDEDTIQIIEYISNTLIDLKHYVNDYITDVFDYKTYVENLSQLQKYIMIFNAINKVFEQIKRENNE